MSDFALPEDVTKYQSLIGSLQWTISLGRFNIQMAVMTLLHFRAQLHKGNLERAKQVMGYVKKWDHRVIRIWTKEPDYSKLLHELYLWLKTV